MKKKMTKEEKKAYKLTPVYKYKHYNHYVLGFSISSFISAIAPYIIYCGINYEDLLIEVKEGWKLGTGAVTALMMVGVIAFAKVKKITGGKFLALLLLLLGAYVSYCFGNFLINLYQILLYGAIGIMISYGLDYGNEYFATLRDENKSGKPKDTRAKKALNRFFNNRVKKKYYVSKEDKEIPTE